jgi:fatty-acyl-CoA synthase
MSDLFTADELPGGLSALLDALVQRMPDLTLRDERGTFTVAELAQRVQRVAGGLAAWGVQPGDRVAISMRNSREWLEAWFAIAHAGAVLVPLNTRLSVAESEYVLRHGDVRWVIWRPGDGAIDAEALRDLQAAGLTFAGRAVVGAEPAAEGERSYESLADAEPIAAREDGMALGMIQYTSGSTAFPKGAMLRNAGLVLNGHGIGRAWQLGPQDRVLVSNPLFHCGGSVFSFMAAVTHGASPVLMASWRAQEGADLIEREQVTVAPVIDAALRDLVAHARSTGRRLPSLRLASTAAERDLFEKVVDALGCEVSNVYGLTECSPNVCVGDLADPLERRLAFIGRPQPGIELSLRDSETGTPVPEGGVGEIHVRGGASIMLGYHGDAGATAAVFTEDGFLRTGDLGSIDPDGYLAYRGRAKLMLKSGGENVAIEEVEEALRGHDALADAVVVPIPHERYGEVGFAYLRRHAGAEVEAAEVLQFCRGALAGFKVPKAAVVVDDLPRTGSGKVDRTTLTAQARAQAQAQEAQASERASTPATNSA